MIHCKAKVSDQVNNSWPSRGTHFYNFQPYTLIECPKTTTEKQPHNDCTHCWHVPVRWWTPEADDDAANGL